MKKIITLIIAVHLFVLTQITFFPNSEMFIYPYLTNSGLLPYKQILDQHFPGLLFLPINFDNLGMRTPKDALLWQMAVVAITHLFIFILAKKVLGKSKFVFLICISPQPSLSYLATVFRRVFPMARCIFANIFTFFVLLSFEVRRQS